MMRSVLVAVVMVVLTESGLAAEKLTSCCEKVTTQKITAPILGYWVQKEPVAPCVKAVVFQTKNGLFCVYHRAFWVPSAIKAFEKTKHQTTAATSVSPSHVSLLSIITSTVSPSSSAAASPSSLPAIFSTSERPVGENISDDNE